VLSCESKNGGGAGTGAKYIDESRPSEGLDESVAFVINRANNECEAGQVIYALDYGIFLDGKVDNLV